MEEFQAYATEEVILDNLAEIYARICHSEEQERAHLRELAAEIANGIADSDTDASAFLASLSEHKLPHHSNDPDMHPADATRRRARLALELSRLLASSRDLLFDALFPIPEHPDDTSRARISYQKNGYTDLAYEQFSTILENPRATYAHGFASVCEDVYNGVSEYCILPIENSAEGRLNSFSRLIAQYDLKIIATCEVQTGADRSTRFALLRRTAALLASAKSLPLRFECVCELSGGPDATDVLSAARDCGLAVLHAEISADSKNPTQHSLHLTLSAEQAALSAFLLYLAMEIPLANLIGLYPDLAHSKKR